jgi:predicted unusual protein kinase regulating ubiquinone biosynthesis (AarF/ABC1/UbiB family)
VWASHSTERVLTTEHVAGRRFAEVLSEDEAARSRWGEILYRFVFDSIFRHGVFNGDPQPGNYLFDAEGRVAFLDFGCVKRFPGRMLEQWKQLIVSHMEGDRERFRRLVIELSFLKPDAATDPDLMYRYLGVFYEPFHHDRRFTYTREYSRRTFETIFRTPAEFRPIARSANMPPDFVLVNRIQWGVESILGQLGATANWHRIQRELLFGDAPSTELGRIDAEYRARGRAGAGEKRAG